MTHSDTDNTGFISLFLLILIHIFRFFFLWIFNYFIFVIYNFNCVPIPMLMLISLFWFCLAAGTFLHFTAVSLPQQTGFSFMAALPSDQTPPPPTKKKNELIITVACLLHTFLQELAIHKYKNLLQTENFQSSHLVRIFWGDLQKLIQHRN